MVKKLFLAKCAICHGDDGRLGYNNSKDLTVSILTRDEIIALVKTGKNTMPPHENILSQEQIEALTDFTLQLRVKP
ncbi:MAG: cytochrome c [Flavobacteriales bacterium]|nr:cytochrome c [Flavobacteriales bacterium]